MARASKRHFLVIRIVFWSFSWGGPGKSLQKAFPGSNNLVLEPVLGGPRGQGLWKEFRSILGVLRLEPKQ